MKKNNSFWQEIDSEIKNEIMNINQLVIEIAEEKIKDCRRAQGSILHDFYNCCERIFRKISLGINGGFLTEEAWHKELLYRITIPLKGVRPVVISQDLAAKLDEYLSFRHVFRNIYGFELSGERLERLRDKFPATARDFKREIEDFLRKMEAENAR